MKMKVKSHSKKVISSVKVIQRLVMTVSSLTFLFPHSSVFASSSRQELEGGTVIITCNNNSGRSEAQFQLISSVGIINLLNFDLIFDNGETINVTTPTQPRRSITGFRDAMGLATLLTIEGRAFGLDDVLNVVRYDIPAFGAKCDNIF
jgi:hypothetical protein